MPAVEIDLYSDVVCPWCWIGKHRLQKALEQAGLSSDVRWRFRAYELGPRQQAPSTVAQHLGEKYGVGPDEVKQMLSRVEGLGPELGLHFDFTRAKTAQSFDAHRLVKAAEKEGKGPAMMERLHRAHFSEGQDISDAAVLESLALAVGLEPAEAKRVIGSDAYGKEVDEDEARAASYEIRGVPFTIINGRVGVAGAQSVAAFVQALQQAQSNSPKEEDKA
jgi:predicted DsbA family dithiol-disulfide isomerase